ncbi:hypothetical protein Tco_1313123 [Tanacetum coccineum]
MHPCIAWDKVDYLNPQSTPQVLLSFEIYTPPVTYPEKVDETIRIPMAVEPFDHMKLEVVGLNPNNNTAHYLVKRLLARNLGPKPVLRSFLLPIIDPQCHLTPPSLINVVKAHFNDAIVEPQQPEEPEPTLEDEFKDLHLNSS